MSPQLLELLLAICLLLLLLSGGLAWVSNRRLQQINSALKESERSKAVLIANLPGIAYRCRYDPDWTMEFLSQGCDQLTGYPVEHLLGNRRLSWNDIILPEDREAVWQVWDEARENGLPCRLEYRIRRADGQVRWVFEQGDFVRDSQGEIEALEGLIIDITDRKMAEAELYRQSTLDHVTGLYNRRYLMERLNQLLAEHRREPRPFSLAILDLDHFKQVNDAYGHQAGDQVLAAFSRLLQSCCRPYDLVGRYGGEEFMAIILNRDTAAATQVMERFRAQVAARAFAVNGDGAHITVSIGVAASGELGSDDGLDELIRLADQRLYAAKELGRDRVVDRDQPGVSSEGGATLSASALGPRAH